MMLLLYIFFAAFFIFWSLVLAASCCYVVPEYCLFWIGVCMCCVPCYVCQQCAKPKARMKKNVKHTNEHTNNTIVRQFGNALWEYERRIRNERGNGYCSLIDALSISPHFVLVFLLFILFGTVLCWIKRRVLYHNAAEYGLSVCVCVCKWVNRLNRIREDLFYFSFDWRQTDSSFTC